MTDDVVRAFRGHTSPKDVGLTWHNPNTPVLAEGPEIVIKPVGIRRLASTSTQASGRGGDI
jgi:hypothetical protein